MVEGHQTPLHRSQWTICANAHHRLTSISLSFGGLRIILYHIIIISTIVSMGTLHPVRLSYVVSASRFTPPLLLSPTSDSPVHVLFHMMTMIGPQRYPYDKGRVQKPQSRKNSVLFTFSRYVGVCNSDFWAKNCLFGEKLCPLQGKGYLPN